MSIKFVVSTVALVAALVAHSAQAQSTPFTIGQPMPPVKNYEYADGKAIDFAEFKGKPFVVYFGADWCPPCFLARPTASDVAKKYSVDGVKVLVMLSDPEKRRAANMKWAEEKTLLLGLSKRELCENADCKYGVKGGPWAIAGGIRMPSAWVVDKDGVLTAQLSTAQAICDFLETEVKKALSL